MNHHIYVSGRTYRAALDPLSTGAESEGLVSVESRRVGKSRQYCYELDDAQLDVMINRLDAVGVSLLDSDGFDDRCAEGRACLADRDKLRGFRAVLDDLGR